MSEMEQVLFEALERMQRMHQMMMRKVNHGASYYDADTLREMNEAPIQAERALNAYRHAEEGLHG